MDDIRNRQDFRAMVPVAVHMPLMIISQMVAAGCAAVSVLVHAERVKALGMNPGFAAMVVFLVAGALTRLLFMSVICGRCLTCGAPLRVRGVHPVTYDCTHCVHVHRTEISEGD